MLSTALRDLRWRLIHVVPLCIAAAILLALSAVIAGWSSRLADDASELLRGQGAQTWIAPSDAPGPFSAGIRLDDAMLQRVRAMPDVLRVDPVLASSSVVSVNGISIDVMVLGVDTGGLGGFDKVETGATVVSRGEVIVPLDFGVDRDGSLSLGDMLLTVVGVTKGGSNLGEVPVIVVNLADAQETLAAGEQLFSMMVIRGESPDLPAELKSFDAAATRADVLRPTAGRRGVYSALVSVLHVAAISLVGLASWQLARARSSDVAAVRSLGGSVPDVVGPVAIQSTLIAAGTVIAALVFSTVIIKTSFIDLESTLGRSGVMRVIGLGVAMAIVAVVVALAAVVRTRPRLPFERAVMGS